MAGRKYLLIILALLSFSRAKSQQLQFSEVDSTSYAMYLSGDWHQLVKYGKSAVTSGIDFPLLRLRIAYAYFNMQNYGLAIREYQHVLNDDSHNQIAHLYSFWCNRYLNQDAEASYHASYLDTLITGSTHPAPYGLVDAALETGLKFNNNANRGTASYTRIGLSNRIGWHLQLDESLAYYGQSINYRRNNDFIGIQTINNSVKQYEYYGKLTYTPINRLALFGGYHYMNTTYIEEIYHNHIGTLGLTYSGGITALQADATIANISSSTVTQYNAQLTLMPAGNLDLYFISRGSILHQKNVSRFIFSQTAGTKFFKNFWADATVTLGNLNNYMEAEGLYIYNNIDITKFKTGVTGYYLIGNHALLYLNYLYERKKDFYQITSYYQNSVTGGVKWKF